MRLLALCSLTLLIAGVAPLTAVAQDDDELYAEAQRTITRLMEIDPADRALVRRGTAHLANVLREFLLHEARTTDGKVEAPAALTARPGATAVQTAASSEPGKVVPLSEVPTDWLVLRLSTAQAQTEALLQDLDSDEVDSDAIAAALAEIRLTLDEVVRPPAG